jgi:uncharacterized protein YjbK
MTEKEFKILLNEDDYGSIKRLYGKCVSKDVVQINHYFDTDNFFFDEKGVTIRIRECLNRYILTVKVKNGRIHEGKIKVSTEHEFELDYTLFKQLTENITNIYSVKPELGQIFKGWNEEFAGAKYLGNLTTKRTGLKPGDNIPYIELDFNEYLGHMDWELECEVSSQEEIDAFEGWFRTLNILAEKSLRGKYGRFLDRLKIYNSTSTLCDLNRP